MRYSYEYKKMCVELYRQGKWVETPEGVKELSEYDSNLGKNRRIMWCRSTKAQKSKQSVDGRRKIRASG